MKQKVKPKKQHIMKTHVIYSYNGKDIESYGSTLGASSVTKLITTALEHIDLTRSKIAEDHSDEYYLHLPHSSMITYTCKSIDTHGILHLFHFTIKGSPATLRKARKYFDNLDILPF